MTRSGYLGEFEQIVLLAILRLGDNSYGVPIRHEIESRTARSLTVGALYSTLERLEEKGYVTSRYGDPTPERGGRSRRYFKIRPLGLRVLRESREELAAMWEGLESFASQVIRGR
jgi:PadR family transcriptional regulator PadR